MLMLPHIYKSILSIPRFADLVRNSIRTKIDNL